MNKTHKIYAVFSYNFNVDNIPELIYYKHQKNFEIIIIDLTQIFLHKKFYGISREKIYSNSYKVINFNSIFEFKKFIKNNNSIFFLYLTDRMCELKVWYLVRGKKSIVFDYSVSSGVKVTKKLRKINIYKIKEKINYLIFKFVLKAIRPNIFISTTKNSSSSKNKNALIDIHPILYNIKTDLDYEDKNYKNNILIIMGNFFFEDYDFKRCGESMPNFLPYFNLLRIFLKELVLNSFKPIIIFHPKTKSKFIPSWTTEYNYRFGVTSELLLESKIVIGNFSSTLLAAHEIGKAVIILNSINFKDSLWLQSQINEFSKIIKVQPEMIENIGKLINLCCELRKLNIIKIQNNQPPFYNLTLKIKE